MNLLSERLAYIYARRPNLEGDRGQTGLVKASGASKSVVNQWLNEKIKKIDIRYALSIERELGFSHVWLMTGDGDPEVQAGTCFIQHLPRLQRLLPNEDELLEAFRMMPADQQDGIRAMVLEVSKKELGGQVLSDQAQLLWKK